MIVLVSIKLSASDRELVSEKVSEKVPQSTVEL